MEGADRSAGRRALSDLRACDALADSAADRDQEEGTGQRASLSQPADVRDDRLFDHPDRATGHQAGAQAGGQADDR